MTERPPSAREAVEGSAHVLGWTARHESLSGRQSGAAEMVFERHPWQLIVRFGRDGRITWASLLWDGKHDRVLGAEDKRGNVLMILCNPEKWAREHPWQNRQLGRVTRR